ncbi:MAG: EscU/YscU/HrcU family type III secretion system export apparatus switch protein [Alphaproteobacteria bacterium]|nr:EscU/YscU/HrcU family type III secretion system export apparatus switch protein [Alphaproteobacteria bacterium]
MRYDKDHKPAYKPVKQADHTLVAVALRADQDAPDKPPSVVASGRAALAREILDIAFAHGVKVREDSDLAELLVQLDLDTPIPTEALLVVAEIMARVYKANEAVAPSPPPPSS